MGMSVSLYCNSMKLLAEWHGLAPLSACVQHWIGQASNGVQILPCRRGKKSRSGGTAAFVMEPFSAHRRGWGLSAVKINLSKGDIKETPQPKISLL